MNLRILPVLLLSVGLAAAGATDPRGEKATAYLQEVRQVLLDNYIEGDKLKPDALAGAAIDAMVAALDGPDFAKLESPQRDAVKKAIAAAPRKLGPVIEAAAGAAEGLDLLRLADHGAQAMVKSLGDRFSRLVTPEELKKMQPGADEDGPVAPLGLMVDWVDGKCVVIFLRYGFPADEDGVEIGDELVSVDGRPVSGKSSEQIMAWLRAAPNAHVDIGLRKPGMDAAAILPLVQRRHRASQVERRMLDDGVAYVRMTVFGKGLKRQLKRALDDLRKEGMTRLVLDLRHNPGGVMKAAGDAADLFLRQNLVITTVDTRYHPQEEDDDGDGIVEKTLKTTQKSDYEDLPMTVLIDGASASSSELLAGALQDHHRAQLIGTKSYGKGIGQTTIPLKSMSEGGQPKRLVYLTVLRYLLPSGRSIHHTGLVPDLETAAARIAAARFAERCKVRASGAVDAHVDARWKERRAEFEPLVHAGTASTGGIPDLEALKTATKGALTDEELRDEVARVVKQRLLDENPATFFVLPDRDPQLKAGIKALPKAPSPEY